MNTFRLEGEYWTIEFQGTVCRLRDGRGMQYIAYLLYHPGEEVGAAELIGLASGDRGWPSERAEADTRHPTPDAHAERARSAVSKRIKDALQRIHGHNPGLGRHLARSIKTGRMCGYLPDLVEPITWSEL